MNRRLLNFLIALDQFVSVCVTLGGAYPDESISSYAYRLDQQGKPWGKILRPLIDRMFYWQANHCHQSYLAERARYDLPPEMRQC